MRRNGLERAQPAPRRTRFMTLEDQGTKHVSNLTQATNNHFLHCAGSLDDRHRWGCEGIACPLLDDRHRWGREGIPLFPPTDRGSRAQSHTFEQPPCSDRIHWPNQSSEEAGDPERFRTWDTARACTWHCVFRYVVVYLLFSGSANTHNEPAIKWETCHT